jgi:hypothetical protein
MASSAEGGTMSAKAKPSAMRTARDRAMQALKTEKVTHAEYLRRSRRAKADPQQAARQKADDMFMRHSGSAAKFYSRRRDKITDKINKRHGADKAREAWWKAERETRRSIKAMFRRRARTLDDLRIKAQLWQLLFKPEAYDAEIKYYLGELMRLFI